MQWPFEAWGAHAVLSGHDHSYERLHAPNANGGFPFFVNGLVSVTVIVRPLGCCFRRHLLYLVCKISLQLLTFPRRRIAALVTASIHTYSGLHFHLVPTMVCFPGRCQLVWL